MFHTAGGVFGSTHQVGCRYFQQPTETEDPMETLEQDILDVVAAKGECMWFHITRGVAKNADSGMTFDAILKLIRSGKLRYLDNGRLAIEQRSGTDRRVQ